MDEIITDALLVLHRHACWRDRRFGLYGALALVILLGIPQTTPAAESRPWDASVRVFAVFDSNVPLATRATSFTGQQSSGRVGVSGTGSYRLWERGNWFAGAGLSATQTFNTNKALNDFDHSGLTPRLFGGYRFSVRNMPGTARMGYDYTRDWLAGNGFAQAHLLRWDVSLRARPWSKTTVYYHLAFEDFDFDGVQPGQTSRDATQHRLGIGETITVLPQRLVGAWNYQFSRNLARGTRFTFSSHAVQGRISVRTIGPLWITGEIGYSNQDYTRFKTMPVRSQNNWTYRIAATLPLSRHLILDAGWTYSRFIGASSFTAHRSIVAGGVTYQF